MLLVIGLDGATWDLIDPWIVQGELPNLGRLKEQSGWAHLVSVPPAATLPNWTSISTGVNPGRHGIFDFTRRVFGTYEVQFVNGTFRKVPTVWSAISRAGGRVAVLGMPGSYPPEPLNGCMVSGFDSPVTTRADASFVAPAQYLSIVDEAGGFPFADFQEFSVSADWFPRARAALLAGIEKKSRLARTLLAREPWDCFAIVFGESDTVAHHFWHVHDRHSPRYDAPLAGVVGDVVLDVYRALDRAIGEIFDAASPSHWIVASDHGFGGTGAKGVHLNACLAGLGFQVRRPSPGGQLSGALKRVALGWIPPSAQAWAFRFDGAKWSSRLESRVRFGEIDFASTVAFSEELNYFPNVWLNVMGREPEGTVGRSRYESVRDQVCAGLESLADPESGKPIVRRAWRREEVYDGPWTSNAPDIILEFELDGAYSYNVLPTASRTSGEAIRTLAKAEMQGGKLTSMSGSHRPLGVAAWGGPSVETGLRTGVGVADIGATILAMCGVDPEIELDGKSLLARGGERLQTEGDRPAEVGEENPYSSDEEAELENRLAQLGYLG